MGTDVSVKFQVQEKNSVSATGAPVGSLGEPQEDGGQEDLFQEMFLFVNTHQRMRRAGSAFPGTSTQWSISFQARMFLRTKSHPKPLQVSVTGDSQQSRLYFSSSISLEFVRVPAIQKKPTAGSWLNTNCSGAWAYKALGKKFPNKKVAGADEDCNMQNAAWSHFLLV